MTIELANRLCAYRKYHGLSQEELAEKLEISRQAVSCWERAETSPDTDNLILLSKIYSVTLDELLYRDPQEVSLFDAIAERDPLTFCFPVLVLLIYLILGLTLHWWHPGWLVFLTIPIYYTIWDFFD